MLIDTLHESTSYSYVYFIEEPSIRVFHQRLALSTLNILLCVGRKCISLNYL